MRISTRLDGRAAEEPIARLASDQLRLALGSLTQDVQRLSVRLQQLDGSVRCVIRARLRGQRTLTVETVAATLGEALRFAASRIGGAVGRRVQTDRILG